MIDADRIWDDWRAAHKSDPELSPEAFAGRYGDESGEVLAALGDVLALECAVPTAPLVDLTQDAQATFAGFELDRELGRGGSGIVYLALEVSTGREVALKIINPLLATSADRRAALLREAEVAGRLDHPGIVSVAASGVERGYAWMAMEYVEGRRLDDLVEDELPTEERASLTLNVGRQLAEALEYAHAAGVIHRDLKPDNVILDARGSAHVLDFGLAKSEVGTFSISRTGDPIGTPLYMAPEQLRGERNVGPSADLYSLGVLLLELGTGRRIEMGHDFIGFMSRIAHGRHRVPRHLMQRLPVGLREVVSRSVEPHPEDRYPSAHALAIDLEAVAEGRRPPIGALSRVEHAGRYVQRHALGVVLTAALFAATAAGAWWVWWTAPVEVWFDSYDDGKQLSIDGVDLPLLTPVLVHLRPGKHTYQMRFEAGSETFSGSLDIKPRTPLAVFRYLEPFKSLDHAGGPKTKVRDASGLTSGGYGWLQVATPFESIRLTVDGDTFDQSLGSVALPLTLGPHTLHLEVPGRRTIEQEIQVHENRLYFLAFDPEPVDSEWHKLIIYGPFDDHVQSGTISSSNLRVYKEREERRSGTDNTQVLKCYFGPHIAGRDASLTMSVQLPVPARELELELTGTPGADPAPWMEVEMGPDEERLLRVAVHENGQPHAIDASAIADVVSLLDGQRTLVMRFSTGDSPIGINYSYGRFLRTEGVPAFLLGGELLWEPALTIRVR